MNRTGLGKRFSFVLTLEEKRVICFVLLAFLLGLVTKHYRDKQPPPTAPAMEANANAKPAALPSQRGK